MNDREMLEMAAKAAGIEVYTVYPSGTVLSHPQDHRGWRPLYDDSDALRLHVFCYQTYGTEYIESFNEAFDNELSRNPSYAIEGFRRAATMTAAEIGKAMP